MKPLSNLIPSTNSISCYKVFPSYTVIDPCSPTFSIKLAIKSPISLSPLAEIVATLEIYSVVFTGLALALISATTASTA